MQYTRLEMQFRPKGLRRGVLVEGVVAGRVLGATIHASALQVTDTLVTRRQARRRHELAAHVLGASKTELPLDYVTVDVKTRLLTGRTELGRVAAVWCDRQSGLVTHLLARSGGGTLRIVPAELIERVQPDGVRLKLSRSDFDHLAPYRSDDAIAADIALAFEAALPDPRARRDVKVRVEDGHVTLAGTVSAAEERERARRAAAAVAGVRDMTVDLVVEEALADIVEAAVAHVTAAPELVAARVRVFTEHGIVYLEGRVPTPAARDAIERASIAVPGVRVVVNNLLADGEPPSRAADTGPLTRNR